MYSAVFSNVLSNVLTLSTGPAISQSEALSIRFTVILTIAVICLFSWMLIFYAVSASRFKKMDRLKASIKKSAEDATKDPSLKAADILPPVEDLLGKANISALNELFEVLDEDTENTLKRLLKQLDSTAFISQGLDEKYNDEYLVDLMRIAGSLGIISLANKMTALVKKNRNNIDIVFEALMALAYMNSSKAFIEICMDKKYIKYISFRNLQEIIIAYTGNREALYKRLLSAPDDYVVRICIKRIGSEEITSLVPKTLPFLDNKNYNLIIETLRTISILKYKPAAAKIQKLLKHSHWEVRNAVVKAVASIDLDSYIDSLIEALQDNEWFVRYNAGLALSKAADFKKVRDKVQATNDKFAIEMLDYMSVMNNIRGVK